MPYMLNDDLALDVSDKIGNIRINQGGFGAVILIEERTGEAEVTPYITGTFDQILPALLQVIVDLAVQSGINEYEFNKKVFSALTDYIIKKGAFID